MADRMTLLPARLADAWAPGLAAGNPLVVRRLERVAATGLGAMLVTPVALCLAISPAIALPVGVGVAAAISLAAAVYVTGKYGNPQPAGDPVAPAPALSDNPLLAVLPGLVTVHSERGLVTHVSGRDRDILMHDLRSLEGKGFLDQIHVSDRIIFLQAVDRLRQGDKGAEAELRFESVRSTESGRSQFVHRRLMLTGLADPKGVFCGFFCQMLDSSAEEQLKQQLSLKAEEAQSANEAKTRFLAAVSHELRTPLNAILGFSDILSGEYFGKLENDRQREYVSLINQSGNHLLGVVNTMLDMSKIEAGRYELICESFVAAEAAATCDAMLSLQAKNKGVTLTARVSRDAGELVADRRAVQQVLINLVGNAIKFTDAGGVVTLDVERRAGEVVFSVSDTGIGIAEDKIALLGRPFVQVQSDYARKYEGTGLGLSLVKGLVELHGGRVTIQSRLGEGTVVSVAFPADGHQTPMHVPSDAEASVEFPPRLPAAANSMKDKKENAHGNAKAQTA